MTVTRTAAMMAALACAGAPAGAYAMGSWMMGDPTPAVTRPADPAAAPAGSGPTRRAAPVASGLPMRARTHRVDIRVVDGFARTEVTQVWGNPNGVDSRATYRLPLPPRAALAELAIEVGGRTLAGEVRPEAEARDAFEEAASEGDDAGLASKEGRRFDFEVARVPAGGEVTVTFAVLQPLEVEAGVVRYVYPAGGAAGGATGEGAGFWAPQVEAAPALGFTARVRSAWPIADVRVPGTGAVHRQTRAAPGDVTVAGEADGGRDLVFYYRLEADLPGRVEVHAYRPEAGGPGTFMAVLTPGADLPPIAETGADHVYVVDTSGSMQAAMAATKVGLAGSLRGLAPPDRFRLFAFSNHTREYTPGFVPAEPAGLARGARLVETLRASGGTDLYTALEEGLEAADKARATNLLLVTDGETNQGFTDRAAFLKLVRETDVRIHGFLIGSGANWPLLETITATSGGSLRRVSGSDDLAGVLALTREKLVSEALHDVRLEWAGVPVAAVTDAPVRLYRGEQLVVFGRYDTPGEVALTVHARVGGKPRTYPARFELPAVAPDTPELERLWAVTRAEDVARARDEGRTPDADAKAEISRLGVLAQVVTDETAMVLLRDERFASRGITRANRARAAAEREVRRRRAGIAPSAPTKARYPAPAANIARPARSVSAPRRATPAPLRPARRSRPAPSRPFFPRRSGGGAIDPFTGLAALGLAWAARREDGEGAE